jgi:hypothetical protein
MSQYKKPGQPTKYKPEYAQMMLDYFDIQPYEVNEDGKLKGNRMPTLERFAIQIDVDPNCLYTWANAKDENNELLYPEFFSTYNKCKAMQKDILVTNGLLGNYVSNFAIFVATNFTDMASKSEVDNTSGGERIAGFNYIIPKDKDDNRDPDISNT